MTSEEVVETLKELASENELYKDLWDQLEDLKNYNPDGFDAFIGDIVLNGVEDKDELETYLMNLWICVCLIN